MTKAKVVEATSSKQVDTETELKPCIMVLGIGGAGGNAINNMIRSQLEGVDFIAMNTDAQAVSQSLTDNRIQLGVETTKGLGAGASPEVGTAAAEESEQVILEHIKDANMIFIAAGMGGGTGTGAAPIVAQVAREKGILTVGVVTKPFGFEGSQRMVTAEKGIEELQKHVDTLIVIPNQNLFRIANEGTTFADAFKMADDVLYAGVRSITDLMIMPGLINLDFADVRSVMGEMGKAMMGTGEADGEGRALAAAESAIDHPLYDDVSMKGARGVLISITGGMDMTLFEVDEAANRIREEVESDANIIFGSTFDERLNGRLRVSVVATGIDSAPIKATLHTTSTASASSSASLAQGGEVQKENQSAETSVEQDPSASYQEKPSESQTAPLLKEEETANPTPEPQDIFTFDGTNEPENISTDSTFQNFLFGEGEEMDYLAPSPEGEEENQGEEEHSQMEMPLGDEQAEASSNGDSGGGFFSRFLGRKKEKIEQPKESDHAPSEASYQPTEDAYVDESDGENQDSPAYITREGEN